MLKISVDIAIGLLSQLVGNPATILTYRVGSSGSFSGL